jgi:LPS O-antigen subunit length determinant protein (WzzB/FepE family)
MKKNNSYLVDDEIDLANFIGLLWREKITIFSISIVCGLVGYFYASFQPQEFKTEITLKNPPFQHFEFYSSVLSNNNSNNFDEQFISDFKLNFLSPDNLEKFVEESGGYDNFKGYLRSRNITVKQYFEDNKLGQVKEKNQIIPNKYFLIFPKELEGRIFFNNYAEFIKKKTVFDFKKNLKLSIENNINNYELALESAKIINLENPILKSMNQPSQVVNEPEALFYKGTKILAQNIIHLKKLFIKLENDQFNYNPTSDSATFPLNLSKSLFLYSLAGLVFGFFFSLIIILLKNTLKSNS